jgi:hypothetical protein
MGYTLVNRVPRSGTDRVAGGTRNRQVDRKEVERTVGSDELGTQLVDEVE